MKNFKVITIISYLCLVIIGISTVICTVGYGDYTGGTVIGCIRFLLLYTRLTGAFWVDCQILMYIININCKRK